MSACRARKQTPGLTLAFPMGCTKSLSRTFSDTGNDSPYSISFSRNTTGSGSLMAAFSSPLASSASYGASTCKSCAGSLPQGVFRV